MQGVIKADEVKHDFDDLKTKWASLLSKYFKGATSLDPKYTVEVSCPHCQATQVENSFALNGFHHHTCVECSTLYVSPRLSDECIEELYSNDYYDEVYRKSMIPVFEKRKELIGKNKYKQIISYVEEGKKGRILDVGAGVGEVVDVFHEEGWQVHATEMNGVGLQWLKNRNYAEVFHGTLNEYKTEHSFDVIMAWGVIEHVLEPDAFLKRIYALLKPGGVFVSEVPHSECLLVKMALETGFDPKRILMGEQHIVLYSTQAYENLHKRNSFKKLHVQTNGLDVSTIFREFKIDVPVHLLSAIQNCVDEKLYGDLLRGFWTK